MTISEMLTGEELAKLLKRTPGWVRRNARLRGIKRIKVGNAWRYPEDEVRKWIQEQMK